MIAPGGNDVLWPWALGVELRPFHGDMILDHAGCGIEPRTRMTSRRVTFRRECRR